MSGQFNVMVVTSDAGRAQSLSKRLDSDPKIVAKVVSGDELENSLKDFSPNEYHALILSDSIGSDCEERITQLTQGRNIPIFKMTEAELHNGSGGASAKIDALPPRVSDLLHRLSLANSLQKRNGDMISIIDKSADSILIFNEDGIILFMNPAARSFFAGKLKVSEEFGYPVVNGDTTEIDLIDRSGARVVAEMRVTPVEWQGEPSCLAILRDVTERKVTEELLEQKVEERTSALESATEELVLMYNVSEQAVRLRTKFIATVSHEIRTPLAGIVSGADLLCQTSDPEMMKELGAVILTSATRLLELVNQILDFSRAERGEFLLTEAEFSIEVLVNEVSLQMQALAQQRKLTLTTKFSPSLANLYFGDSGKLRQILLNLVHNALKFTRAGGATITVEPSGGGMVLFSIRDTGIGIDEGDLKLIFQPFVQAFAGSEAHEQSNGTGLGLSICSQLARALHGELACQSKLGEGSAFVLKIPLREK